MGLHSTVTIPRRDLEDQIMYLQSTLATLEAQRDAQDSAGDLQMAGLAAAQNQEPMGNSSVFEETILPIAAG